VTETRYRQWIFGACGLSLVFGLVLLALAAKRELWGDGYFYHYSANLIVEGKGWINPLHYRVSGAVIEAADHPPSYIAYLALWSLVGLKSIFAHQVATVLVAVAAVPLFANIGRRLGGPRVGVAAALIGAAHPAMWGWSKMIMSEPMAVLGVLALLIVALEWREQSKTGQSLARITVLFGLAIGFAALSRAELLLLGVILAFICFAERSFVRFMRSLIIAGIVAALSIAPWVLHNLARFDETVLLSNGAQITLAATNCPETYGGQFQAFWLIDCSNRATEIAKKRIPNADQSQIMNDIGRQAWDYINENKKTAVKTVFLRLGRVMGVYRPLQQINLDHFPEGRTRFVAISAWAAYFALLPFVIAGGLMLRKRNRTLPIFLAPVGVALFTCAITFGNTRYRMSAEPTMIVFASLAMVATVTAITRWWTTDSGGES